MRGRYRSRKSTLKPSLKNSIDGIILLAENSCILQVNQGFTHLVHYGLEKIKGKALPAISVFQEDESFIQKVLKGQQVIQEASKITSKGLLHLKIKGIPIFIHGQVKGGYLIYANITEEKSYEEQLKHISLHDTLTSL